MAKKLTMKTKLSEKQTPETPKEKLNLVKEDKTYPRSYRWREYDLELIDGLVGKVNKASQRKIDATKIIRGALYMANKRRAKQILEAIMEAEKNSLISKLK